MIDKIGLYESKYEHDACGIGVVANIDSKITHETIDDALKILENLNHRGASGADLKTGDGAGILFQIPHTFFKSVCPFDLPEERSYAVMQAFFSPNQNTFDKQSLKLNQLLKDKGFELLGKRIVPTNTNILSELARNSMPHMMQIFINKKEDINIGHPFEYALYKLRKYIEKEMTDYFYISSLSSKTIVYKGMLTSLQIRHFYTDLSDLRLKSAFATVHARFSTNTFPAWHRAHPNRYIMHNGEINTIRGNVNWMRSRQDRLKKDYPEINDMIPIIDETGSDSSMFDNALEFLLMTGRSLPHALMMMIPEPWENNTYMDPKKRDFYEFHNFLMEPWEGPAAMIATDGDLICASLDRNGLRPSRYTITNDNRLVLASEVGVLDIDEEKILTKGRLMPGKMLVVDLGQKRIISDDEIKLELANKHDYKKLINDHLFHLNDFETTPSAKPIEKSDLLTLQKAFGYSKEDIDKIITPMALGGSEPIGSMGYDAPLAILSNKPYPLYHYFKHAFAQVTNPPLDGLREKIITSSKVMIGGVGNLIEPIKESNYATLLDGPILSNGQLADIKSLDNKKFKTMTISTLYDKHKGTSYLKQKLDQIFSETLKAYEDGYNLFILSDRGVDKDHVAMPMLLAASGLHHFFIKEEIRTDVSIICEVADAKETHHFAALFGYGVTAINPYLAFETLKDLVSNQKLGELSYKEAKQNYIDASHKGMMKILSKMGISTMRSYHGTQLFEAVGISRDVVDAYFTGTSSKIGGLSLKLIASEAHMMHDDAFNEDKPLEIFNKYKYYKNAESHLLSPKITRMIQQSSKDNNYEQYKELTDLLYGLEPIYLRQLLTFNKHDIRSIDIEEVESIESILKHFNSGAMSYGSLSQEAHETIAIAMNKMKAKSNSGEGGEDASRYESNDPDYNKTSAIKQIASGRFGVTLEYLTHAKELQIKIAQGAKPGEGGHLPGDKVYPWIAKTRHSTPGVSLISPPPHHDIYSIEDLAELIYDLKKANHKADISVKLVSQSGVGTVAVGVAKGYAHKVLISGYDGGTGAAPLTSLQHAGLPWEIGLSEVHQTLVLNNLRNRVKVETDGKLLTGRDVIIAAILGAEEFGFATLPLILEGCVMCRQCHLNTCPVGIATQDETLRSRFKGKPEYIINYFNFMASEIREILASLGVKSLNELVGRTDLLAKREELPTDKLNSIDFTDILFNSNSVLTNKEEQPEELSFDEKVVIPSMIATFDQNKKNSYSFKINNTDRSIGTFTGSYLMQKGISLNDDTLTLDLYGSAGQSFGAFIPKGMTLNLSGDANDYLGKGLSGGKIIVKPKNNHSYIPEKNIIIGNVSFYGATSGYGYIRGIVGERFGVRNSGATLVCEGTGDHACEYMTGGIAYILGPTGKNIAAGMSGGIIYIYDLDETMLNKDMVVSLELNEEDKETIIKDLSEYIHLTNSDYANHLIKDLSKFRKVVPK